VALAVTLADLWSKHQVFELLQVKQPEDVEKHTPAVVIPGFFELQANYNRGAFSGWFSDHTDFLVVLSALALVVILGIVVHLLKRGQKTSLWLLVALGLIWGGTLGNLHDRYLYAAVRDWIKWFVVVGGKEHVWPNFNIADSAICVGVAILLCRELGHMVKERRSRRQAAEKEKAGKAAGAAS
jgi:signal peptidase II